MKQRTKFNLKIGLDVLEPLRNGVNIFFVCKIKWFQGKNFTMEVLRKVAEDCAHQFEGMWLQCCYEVITNNNIHQYVFAAALRDLVEHGPEKFINIMIIGPANSVCNFQSMKSPVELNILLSKFVISRGLLYHLIRRDSGRLEYDAFTSNPIVSSKQQVSGLKITN